MGKYILSIFLLISCGVMKQPKAAFECQLLDEEIIDFKFDVFGNLYTTDLRNRLKVYDKDMNFLFEYYNNILGEISFVDVTNPKKIILFFDGFQKVIFVDDTLYEIGRYEGEFNILAMGSSRDNNMWIYDGLDYRLKKISSNGKVLLESNPLESYHNLNILPSHIVEYNNMVYMIEEGRGMAILDNFGNFSSYLEMSGATSFALREESMIYIRDGVVYQQLLEKSFGVERKIKALPATTETAFIFKKTVFYLEEQCLKSLALD